MHHVIVNGTSFESGAFDVHFSFWNRVYNFFTRFFSPPAFRGGICFTAHSNCNASILLRNPSTKHRCCQPAPLSVVYLAPPQISPLCCRNRRVGSGETPAYV